MPEERVELPNSVSELDTNQSVKLPSGLTEIPAKEEELEANNYVLSYYFYNDKECEVCDLLKNISKRALQDFRVIGRCSSVTELRKFGIDYLPVDESGEYRKLYSRLPEFTDLREHKISGEARLFYFIYKKNFCVITIKNSHLETKKVRRK